MSARLQRALLLVAAALLARAPAPGQPSEGRTKELIYVDSAGVMRWRTSNVEVAMLGANYCLPSASDYRAAGAVNADRKRLIEDDMTHFARMGWDALRLSFWGDWECCDREGNLIANDHLDLLDYLVFQAKRRDLHMLLSPIVTYSSMWPGGDDPSAVGFSRYYKKEELGTNPKAIAAQVNYLKQILNHVNPYTKLALKDEPYICFVELINEPAQHPQDFEGSVSYINALVDAVRETGCQKITFFNLSQDFAMAQAIAASKADGCSFAQYPSGLVSGHELHGNFLRTLDDYSPMLAPELAAKPRVVYEYDMPDVMSGYHYPAMIRTYRSVGAQSAAMFSYDMLATAPYNLGWQTHCLNMVYTPQKAASAVIAGQVMRRIPRMQPVGPYPANTRFGDFRVSYEENLSELVSRDLFYYSNDTRSRPPSPGDLRRIVGFGSSPVVRYEGAGLYYLDKIEDGVWRLEVYPDSIQIDDPFARTRADRLVFRLITRTWPMTVTLPDLGDSFKVEPLNDGNAYATRAAKASFGIRPGAFLLTSPARSAPVRLPDRLPGVPYYLGMREFVCPEPAPFPTTIVLHAQSAYPADQPISIRATVASADAPTEVALQIGPPDSPGRRFVMEHLRGYDYGARLAAGAVPQGEMPFQVVVTEGVETHTFPHDSPVASLRAETYSARVVAPEAPVEDLRPGARHRLSVGLAKRRVAQPQSVGGRRQRARNQSLPAELSLGNDARRLHGVPLHRGPCVGARKQCRRRQIDSHQAQGPVGAIGHAAHPRRKGRLRMEPEDLASGEWKDVVIPLSLLRPARSVMLPQGYPGTWSYWLSPPAGKAAIDVAQVERVQFSLRREDFGTISSVSTSQAAVAIESVSLQF